MKLLLKIAQKLKMLQRSVFLCLKLNHSFGLFSNQLKEQQLICLCQNISYFEFLSYRAIIQNKKLKMMPAASWLGAVRVRVSRVRVRVRVRVSRVRVSRVRVRVRVSRVRVRVSRIRVRDRVRVSRVRVRVSRVRVSRVRVRVRAQERLNAQPGAAGA